MQPPPPSIPYIFIAPKGESRSTRQPHSHPPLPLPDPGKGEFTVYLYGLVHYGHLRYVKSHKKRYFVSDFFYSVCLWRSSTLQHVSVPCSLLCWTVSFACRISYLAVHPVMDIDIGTVSTLWPSCDAVSTCTYICWRPSFSSLGIYLGVVTLGLAITTILSS